MDIFIAVNVSINMHENLHESIYMHVSKYLCMDAYRKVQFSC